MAEQHVQDRCWNGATKGKNSIITGLKWKENFRIANYCKNFSLTFGFASVSNNVLSGDGIGRTLLFYYCFLLSWHLMV